MLKGNYPHQRAWSLLGLMLAFAVSTDLAAAGAETDSPAACLYDTIASAADPWPAHKLAAKTGWQQLAEDDLTHKFRGDVVLTNDRLAVVLRSQGSGAEVYARTATGLMRRAALKPLSPSDGGPSQPTSVAIVENNPGAVIVRATFGAGDAARTLQYRLTTGQCTVEVRPGAGAARLFVQAEARYLAVPDFFGDDMVFDAGSLGGRRLGLPSENFLLGMLGDGNAMLMCVWPSGQQQADAVLAGASPSGERRAALLGGCEIDCLKDKSIWVAFLEGAGLWHKQSLAAGSTEPVNLDWKPPFPARWRADFLKKNGVAESWTFRAAADEEDATARSVEKCPCRIDAGRALVCFSAKKSPAAAAAGSQSVLVYPIDRNRSTPLATFCPMDILRNTLGVGPCQYILQKEGLATETNPTPDAVMTWVETQFKKKKQKKAADEIREMLAQMTEHVKHAQTKMQRYGQFARQTRELLTTDGASADAPLAQRLLPIVESLERGVAVERGAASGAERAAKLAGEVGDLIGKTGVLADCQRLGAEIRGVGAEQDRTLSNCRMAVRWLKQQCRAAAAQDAAGATLARRIESEAERVLK